MDEQVEGQPLEKHRLEVEDYSVDWARRMTTTSETLSTVDSVTVLQEGVTLTDVSSEFVITSQSVSGTKSQWRMGAATTGNQDANEHYLLLVKVSTSTGRKPLSIHRLEVSELADTTAP
jgi:hypothetical protein